MNLGVGKYVCVCVFQRFGKRGAIGIVLVCPYLLFQSKDKEKTKPVYVHVIQLIQLHYKI